MSHMYMYTLVGSVVLAYVVLCSVRYWYTARKIKVKPASTMIIFGSGGHTTEMLRIISNLSLSQISPIYFVVARSDHTSVEKIKDFELTYISHVNWLTLYRSREVKQSWFTSIFTTGYAFLESVIMLVAYMPQVILCNGPGTCVPLCCTAWFLRIISAQYYNPRIVFIESFCRINSLSLTGKILYRIADKFIIQWPNLLLRHKNAEYVGKIC